jgi:hypothetical protein
MRGRFLFVGAAAFALLIASCGGDDNASPTPTFSASPTPTLLATNGGIVPPSPTTTPAGTFIYATASTADERVVALIDSGYTAGLGKISGAVVLHNRNKSEAVVVQYSVTPVYNGADGTPANYTVVLLPDQQLGDAFSTTYPADASVATVKISVPLASARWVPFTSTDRMLAMLSSSSRAEGTVTNPFDHETGALRLTLIARDEGGRILDAKAISLDSIPAGGVADFAVPVSSSITAFIVYVSFANDLPAWAQSS